MYKRGIEMVNVFIDTQVFVDKNFNFNNELFQRLIVAKEDDLISVYLTEIVIKEVYINEGTDYKR